MKIGKPNSNFKHFKRGVKYWINDNGGWLELDWVKEGMIFNNIEQSELEGYDGLGNDGTDGTVLYGLRQVWFDYKGELLVKQQDNNFRILYRLMNDEFNDNSIGPYG